MTESGFEPISLTPESSSKTPGLTPSMKLLVTTPAQHVIVVIAQEGGQDLPLMVKEMKTLRDNGLALGSLASQ